MGFFKSWSKKTDPNSDSKPDSKPDSKADFNLHNASQPGQSYQSYNPVSMIPANPVQVEYQSNNPFSENLAVPPPRYTAEAPPQPAHGRTASFDPGASSAYDAGAPVKDDPFAFLATFDTIFLIDDSGSMAGSSWHEVAAALKSIAPICTQYDRDGIDIYFLNAKDERQFHNVRCAAEVDAIFKSVSPWASTPTGARLKSILKPYLKDLKKRGENVVKPLNIIVITDGRPSDDPESVIIEAAKKLDAMEAQPWQVGIQFIQVGRDADAAEALQQLDDGLSERSGGIRDMVDTVPFSKAHGELSADGIMKVVLGAVNRRLDRKALM